jgi:hypothetical protein
MSFVVGDAHLAEVDLRLVGRRGVVDAHGDGALSPPELVVDEATQRRVPDGQAVACE